MIKIAVDISNATEAEILELNKIIPFGEKQFHFDRNNIEVNFITKKDAEIIMDNMGTKVFLKCNEEIQNDYNKKIYIKTENLILNFLQTSSNKIPIVIVVNEEIKKLLEEKFKDKMNEFSKYKEDILFQSARGLGIKLFKICTPEESLRLSNIILSNCEKHIITIEDEK